MDDRRNKLYKYRPWDVYTKEIILKNQLYLQAVEFFNDRFDCKVNFDLANVTEKEWIETTRRVAEQGLKKLIPEEYLVEKMKHVYKDRGNKGISKFMLESLLNKVGVSSFTTSNDNILMWAHYADSNKGICLEFDYSDKKSLSYIEKVIYSEKYPTANLFKDFDRAGEELRKACITKEKKWEYEEEYRMIHSEKAKCNVSFDSKILTGVIYGCKIGDKKDLIETLKKHKTPVVLYQAKECENEYKLQIIKEEVYGGND